MRKTLTTKQERFARLIFEGMRQREAYIQAGYSHCYALCVVDAAASRLANSVKVLGKLQELQKAADDASVATIIERKQILSEIARATVPDFITEEGIKVDEQSRNVHAISEITSRAKAFRKTGEVINITNLKLHSPTQAIDLLNKMDRLYSEGTHVNVNVNQMEAKVVCFDPREVARAIVEAIRLGLNPTLVGGDGHSEDASLLPTSANIQTVSISESKN